MPQAPKDRQSRAADQAASPNRQAAYFAIALSGGVGGAALGGVIGLRHLDALVSAAGIAAAPPPEPAMLLRPLFVGMGVGAVAAIGLFWAWCRRSDLAS